MRVMEGHRSAEEAVKPDASLPASPRGLLPSDIA